MSSIGEGEGVCDSLITGFDPWRSVLVGTEGVSSASMGSVGTWVLVLVWVEEEFGGFEVSLKDIGVGSSVKDGHSRLSGFQKLRSIFSHRVMVSMMEDRFRGEVSIGSTKLLISISLILSRYPCKNSLRLLWFPFTSKMEVS